MNKIFIRNTNQYAIVDKEDYKVLSKHKWFLHNQGYAIRHSFGKNNKMFLMHREIMNAHNGQQVDHINSNKLDNRQNNLRFSTVAENSWNREITKNNSTGFKGVYENKRIKNEWAKRWYVRIRVSKKYIYGHCWNRKIEAVKEANKLMKKFHGQFVRLNQT